MYQLIKTCSSAGMSGHWPPTLPHLQFRRDQTQRWNIYQLKCLLFHMHGAAEINRFKQELRQWNEVSGVRHHRRNYIWLLDNKRLYFVLNMLQLVLWFVLTFRPFVTYPWQMSGSERYAHFCGLVLYFDQCIAPEAKTVISVRAGAADSMPPDGQLSRQKQQKAKTGQMSDFSSVIQLSES